MKARKQCIYKYICRYKQRKILNSKSVKAANKERINTNSTIYSFFGNKWKIRLIRERICSAPTDKK